MIIDLSKLIYFRFAFHGHKPSKTKDMWHKSYIDFDYKQLVSYKPVTKNLLDYFQHNSLVLELWGKQSERTDTCQKWYIDIVWLQMHPLHVYLTFDGYHCLSFYLVLVSGIVFL